MYEEIGQRVHKLRISYDMTVDKLSELLGLTTHTINAIEKGKRGTKVPSWIALSTIFNTSLDYLLAGAGEEPKKITEESSAYELLSYMQDTLDSHQLLKMAELAKIFSLNKYSREEIDLLFEAMRFQVNYFEACKKQLALFENNI